jgi:hypothetical protein
VRVYFAVVVAALAAAEFFYLRHIYWISGWRGMGWYEHHQYVRLFLAFAFWIALFVMVRSAPFFFRQSRALGWLSVGVAMVALVSLVLLLPALN